MRISTPVTGIVDENGNMLINFKTWTQLVSNLSMLDGTGSPEGIESAMRTRLYMDIAGSPGSRLYIKTVDADGSGNDKNGWEAV